MAWVEMILEFIGNIVHYAAWPVVLIIVLYLFRRPITALIDRIKSVRYKGAAVDLSGIPDEVRKNIKAKDSMDVTRENLSYENHLNMVEVLALYIAVLASHVRQYEASSPIIVLSQGMLDTLTAKLKADKPQSKLIKFLRTDLFEIGVMKK